MVQKNKDKFEQVEDVIEKVKRGAKKGEEILGKGKKLIPLAREGSDILKKAKESAGKSKCDGKNCSWKEKLMDFGGRAIKGGKSLMEDKEKIKGLFEKGKKLLKK
jgi:hypothetical protein